MELASCIAELIRGTDARWLPYVRGRTGRCLADLEALLAAGRSVGDILTVVRAYLAGETERAGWLATTGPGLPGALGPWFGALLEAAELDEAA